jgi:hypothetical protein
MRKLIAIVLVGICITAFLFYPISVKASGKEIPVNETRIVVNGELKQVKVIHVFDDGSQLLEGQLVVVTQKRGSLTAQKPYYHCKSNGTVLWTATVTGTFTYNGSSSSCTNASYSTETYSNSWSEQSGNAYPSGNSAIADVVMIRRLLFIIVETVPVTITLTCDKHGNLT